MDKNVCSRIYEDVFSGKRDGHFIYKNERHGIMVILDPEPIADGHIVAATLACTDTVDHLPERLFEKLSVTAQTAGLVLETVYPDAPYIAAITAGRQIRHPHIHRAPGDIDADWAKRIGKADNYPRFSLTDETAEKLVKLLTSGDQIRALWEQLDKTLDSIGPTDELTLDTIKRPDLPLN